MLQVAYMLCYANAGSPEEGSVSAIGSSAPICESTELSAPTMVTQGEHDNGYRYEPAFWRSRSLYERPGFGN